VDGHRGARGGRERVFIGIRGKSPEIVLSVRALTRWPTRCCLYRPVAAGARAGDTSSATRPRWRTRRAVTSSSSTTLETRLNVPSVLRLVQRFPEQHGVHAVRYVCRPPIRSCRSGAAADAGSDLVAGARHVVLPVKACFGPPPALLAVCRLVLAAGLRVGSRGRFGTRIVRVVCTTTRLMWPPPAFLP